MGSLCPSKQANGADYENINSQLKEELKNRIKELINEFHKCFVDNVVKFFIIRRLGKLFR